MHYTFYILYSASADRYYVGQTSILMEERLRKHNSRHRGFTGKFGDWVVVYTEAFATKGEARFRELEVKSWKSRTGIESLISAGSRASRP